jgi:hypothetical protein
LGQIAMFFECFKGLIDLLYVQMSTHWRLLSSFRLLWRVFYSKPFKELTKNTGHLFTHNDILTFPVCVPRCCTWCTAFCGNVLHLLLMCRAFSACAVLVMCRVHHIWTLGTVGTFKRTMLTTELGLYGVPC